MMGFLERCAWEYGKRSRKRGGGEVAGLNPHRLTADWCFLSENRHLLLQIKPWPLHTGGAFKGLGAKSSCDKIFYLKFEMVIPFSVLRAFLNLWICVIWYYNTGQGGICWKFSLLFFKGWHHKLYNYDFFLGGGGGAAVLVCTWLWDDVFLHHNNWGPRDANISKILFWIIIGSQ